MGGRIECYVDIASYYSYVGFADLYPKLDLLAQHGVQVEFYPILIAGLNSLSGNKPPWSLEIKANYLTKDAYRAACRVGKPDLKFPEEFLSRALTVGPERALLYIKAHYPEATFLSALHSLFDSFWAPPHVNLTQDEKLTQALKDATERLDGGKKLFTDEDVQKIMDGRTEMKEVLKSETKRVYEMGAFGLPWLWVTNSQGVAEPFFGSDRFEFIYDFLGVPYQGVELLRESKL